MSSTTAIKILQCADNAETELTMPDIDVTTKISAFIPLLVSFLQKPVLHMKCLFPNGTFVEYSPKHPSKIIDEKDDLPVYELTHHNKHSIRIQTVFDKSFPLKIRFPDSKIITINVRLSDTISPLYDTLASQTGVESEHLLLYHNGKRLVSSNTLYNYSITSKDILDVIYDQSIHRITIDARLCGQRSSFMVMDTDTIDSLWERLRSQLGDATVLSYEVCHEGRTVQPHSTFRDNRIQNMDYIDYYPIVLGGAPPMFVDVQNEDSLMKIQFSSSAPEWRVCNEGINIEGKCTNSDCKAHNQMVIYMHGFHLFDLLHSKAYCPICHKEIVPVKPGFTNCLWHIVSMKASGTYISLPYKRVEYEYQTHDETKAGMAEFSLLHIEASPLDQEYKHPEAAVQSEQISKQSTPLPDEMASPISSSPARAPPLVVPEHCMVCLSSLSSKDCSLLPCGHGAHKECLEKWKKKNTHCVHCEAPLIDIIPCPATA